MDIKMNPDFEINRSLLFLEIITTDLTKQPCLNLAEFNFLKL